MDWKRQTGPSAPSERVPDRCGEGRGAVQGTLPQGGRAAVPTDWSGDARMLSRVISGCRVAQHRPVRKELRTRAAHGTTSLTRPGAIGDGRIEEQQREQAFPHP